MRVKVLRRAPRSCRSSGRTGSANRVGTRLRSLARMGDGEYWRVNNYTGDKMGEQPATVTRLAPPAARKEGEAGPWSAGTPAAAPAQPRQQARSSACVCIRLRVCAAGARLPPGAAATAAARRQQRRCGAAPRGGLSRTRRGPSYWNTGCSRSPSGDTDGGYRACSASPVGRGLPVTAVACSDRTISGCLRVHTRTHTHTRRTHAHEEHVRREGGGRYGGGVSVTG